MVQIGKVTSTHGIKGEVKIYSQSDFNRFFAGQQLILKNQTETLHLTIEKARFHKNQWIVLFKGYNNINDVLNMINSLVFIEDIDLESLDEDDYHYQQLIGKDVFTNQGEHVGKIIHMIEVPQGHLMEIERTSGKKTLIPFVKAFVGDIDSEKVIIKPIEGML